MDGLIKLSILDEVDTQCWLSKTSFEKFLELVNDPETRQRKDVWKYLQSFLAHAGILATLIFKEGNPDKTKRVTEFLKQELSMENNSPIKDREGRNFLEHIEAFEIYAANRTDSKGILQSVFENKKGLEIMSPDRYYYKRVLVLSELLFYYQSQQAIKELALKPIYEEIVRIFKKSDEAKDKLNIIRVN